MVRPRKPAIKEPKKWMRRMKHYIAYSRKNALLLLMGERMTPALFLLILALLKPGGTAASVEDKPLPELSAFLQNVRNYLHSNSTLQSNYTFTEKDIYRQLDDRGNVKKTESRVWEVYPSAEPQLTYRKLILSNEEVPNSKEIEKNERVYDQRRREWERKHTQESADDKKRREAKEAEAKRKEEEELDEAFHIYQITMTGREQVEGIPAIILTFEPHASYKPKISEGKILSRIHGSAWISETDFELMRLEAELSDNVSFGFGILARINKGTRLVFQRRKVNNEIWLPAMSRLIGSGKILLFKGLRIDQETIFSDYQKFSVETSTEFGKPNPQPSKPETMRKSEENLPEKK